MSDTDTIKIKPADQREEIKKGLRAIWRHVKPLKKELNILVGFGIVSAVANGFVPYVTGRFFDTLIDLSNGKNTFITSSLPLWMGLLGLWVFVQLIANNIDWV
ncbi:MAG: hypothetical protein WAX25_02205, partial [Minisyncoccia bacterium]